MAQTEAQAAARTRSRYHKARRQFEEAAADRDKFRRTCVEFFEIELRKPDRLQEYILWAALRETAFQFGLVHIWQIALDNVRALLTEGSDEDNERFGLGANDYYSDKRMRGKLKDSRGDLSSRRPQVLIDEHLSEQAKRIALIKERHEKLKARRSAPTSQNEQHGQAIDMHANDYEKGLWLYCCGELQGCGV